VYIRKNDNTDIPYAIGEFHFTCTITVFVIPFTAKDEKDFTDPDNYKVFGIISSTINEQLNGHLMIIQMIGKKYEFNLKADKSTLDKTKNTLTHKI